MGVNRLALVENKQFLQIGILFSVVIGVFVIGYSFFYLDLNPQVCTEAPDAPLDLEELSLVSLLEVGENAPEISQPDVYGNNFSLSALRGKVVLLNFMGTWCASCVWEMGDLIELHNLYANEDVVFLSVAIEANGTINDVIDFKSKYCADWTFILDEDDTFSSFQVELLPTTFVIDRFGVIVYSRVGLLDPDRLLIVLDELSTQ